MTVLASAGLMVVLMGLIWRVFVRFDAKNERVHAAVDDRVERRAEVHRCRPGSHRARRVVPGRSTAPVAALASGRDARRMQDSACSPLDARDDGVDNLKDVRLRLSASGAEVSDGNLLKHEHAPWLRMITSRSSCAAVVMLVISLAFSVTSALAQSEEDWPMRGRTPDGWGYSPLDQINRSNVTQLQIVWSRGFGPNFRKETPSLQEASRFLRQGVSPRVHDGKMYLFTSEDVTQRESVDIQSAIDAIDAATGGIHWRHEHYGRIDLRNPNVPTGFDMYLSTLAVDATGAATGDIRWNHERIYLRNPSVSTGFNRDLAIYGARITGTSENSYVVVHDTFAADKHVFVLDAATGEHVWPTDTGSTPALGMESVAVADSDLDSCLTQFRYSTYSPLTEYCTIANGGTVQAISAETNTVVWEYEQEAAMGRLAATGGGLVFGGDREGGVRAFDHETGEVIWETYLGSPITRSPITYAVGGRQYVAIYTDNNVVFAFAVLSDATCPLSVSHSVSVPLTLYHDNPRPYWFFPFILTDVEKKGTIPPEELFMICEVTHRSTWSERSLWLHIVAAGSKRGWVDAGTYDDLEAFLKH